MTSSAETSQKAVLLDANVLSRLAQIGKLELVPATLPNRCTISPAIYRELEAGVNAGVSYLQAVIAMVQQGRIRLLDLDVEDQQFIASVPRKLAGVKQKASPSVSASTWSSSPTIARPPTTANAPGLRVCISARWSKRCTTEVC